MNEINEIHRCNAEAFGGGELGKERQRKLYGANVVVIGSGVLGQSVLAGLYGLGVRNIAFFDDAESPQRTQPALLHQAVLEEPHKHKKSQLIRETLRTINPSASIAAWYGRFHGAYLHGEKPTLLIDATNSPSSKERALSYATSFKYQHVPIISLHSSDTRGRITAYWPEKHSFRHQSKGLEQLIDDSYTARSEGGFTSGVVAGMAVEEVRKHLFTYNEQDAPLRSLQPFTYNVLSTRRTGHSDIPRSQWGRFDGKKVLVVGAGAIGNWLAAYLPQLPVSRVDFLDYDRAESKNLNRQPLLAGRVNDLKAEVLAEKARYLSGGTGRPLESYAIPGKVGRELTEDDRRAGIRLVTEDELLEKKYDVILGAVDNKHARIWMDYFSTRHGIPYIDGGTSPKAGIVALHVPGKTKTIDQQLDLKSLSEGRRSCHESPNPSVVMSNEITGSLMIGELAHLTFPMNSNGQAVTILQGTLNYASDVADRIYVWQPGRRRTS